MNDQTLGTGKRRQVRQRNYAVPAGAGGGLSKLVFDRSRRKKMQDGGRGGGAGSNGRYQLATLKACGGQVYLHVRGGKKSASLSEL